MHVDDVRDRAELVERRERELPLPARLQRDQKDADRADYDDEVHRGLQALHGAGELVGGAQAQHPVSDEDGTDRSGSGKDGE